MGRWPVFVHTGVPLTKHDVIGRVEVGVAVRCYTSRLKEIRKHSGDNLKSSIVRPGAPQA